MVDWVGVRVRETHVRAARRTHITLHPRSIMCMFSQLAGLHATRGVQIRDKNRKTSIRTPPLRAPGKQKRDSIIDEKTKRKTKQSKRQKKQTVEIAQGCDRS